MIVMKMTEENYYIFIGIQDRILEPWAGIKKYLKFIRNELEAGGISTVFHHLTRRDGNRSSAAMCYKFHNSYTEFIERKDAIGFLFSMLWIVFQFF